MARSLLDIADDTGRGLMADGMSLKDAVDAVSGWLLDELAGADVLALPPLAGP